MRPAQPRTPKHFNKAELADRGRSNGHGQFDRRGPESDSPDARASLGAESEDPSRDRPAASRPATPVGKLQGADLRRLPEPVLNTAQYQATTPNPRRPTFSNQRADSRMAAIASSKVEFVS